MTTIFQTHYEKDLPNKKILVNRTFNAPVELVWKAWTQQEILDRWWAPKPWRAETKTMNFTVGGVWLYAMIGPEGETHWSKADYKSITPNKSFTCVDCFCDENGVKNDAFQTSAWQVNFEAAGNTTKVYVEITFEKAEDLQKMVEMGFEQGFAMGHNNLDEVLKTMA
ncbi:MAG TPA: SRPBCC domain-containing protein [Chitinophagaceae bacterium]|nr:SRPBCC domain-containing protein [Chitinophagaceae bacterium]